MTSRKLEDFLTSPMLHQNDCFHHRLHREKSEYLYLRNVTYEQTGFNFFKLFLNVAIPIGWIFSLFVSQQIFQYIKFCAGITTNRAATDFKSSDVPLRWKTRLN